MQKRENKSKEQIEAEMKNAQTIKRHKAIIIDEFYPALVKVTKSVEEAESLVQALASCITGEVMASMRTIQFSTIKENILKTLTDETRKADMEAFLDTLKDENLFDARTIVEGMSNVIKQMIREEMQGRTLETLNADWTRFLNK